MVDDVLKMLAKFEPLEIRTNHRFAAYKGKLKGKPVFIKTATDKKLRNKLLREAVGLINMKEIDSGEELYEVPAVIELMPEYLVAEWANGKLMKDDFKSGDLEAVKNHLSYLLRLYIFFDNATRGQKTQSLKRGGDTKINIDKAIKDLSRVKYEMYLNKEKVTKLAQYIRDNAKNVETRFTNGDLQPGNLIVDGDKITVIDCESCSWLWPRHYNTVNFVFNYGAEYPELRRELGLFFDKYIDSCGLGQKETSLLNISAALRVLQIIYDRLGPHNGKSEDIKLDVNLKNYINVVADNILDNKLFFSGLNT